MTTICYDGKNICVDNAVTEGDFVHKYNKWAEIKLKKRKGKSSTSVHAKVAGVGNLKSIIHCARYLSGDTDVKPETDDETDILVVYYDKDWNRESVIVFEGCNLEAPMYIKKEHTPAAWGSGAEYALGAMDAGKTAEEAVEMAGKKNISTGFGVTHL